MPTKCRNNSTVNIWPIPITISQMAKLQFNESARFQFDQIDFQHEINKLPFESNEREKEKKTNIIERLANEIMYDFAFVQTIANDSLIIFTALR